MIVEQSKAIVAEVNKALIGKQEVVEQALMAIYAGGHILLEDVPGTGKTTLALHCIAEYDPAFTVLLASSEVTV